VWEAARSQEVPEPFLNKFREATKPEFDKIRQGYEERLTSVAPYEEFVNAGIPRDQLVMGYRLLQLANTNPAELVSRLSGWMEKNQPQGTQTQPQQQTPEPEAEPDYGDLGDDPRFTEFQKRFEKNEQTLASIQEEKYRDKANQEVQKEYEEIKALHAASPISQIPLQDHALFERLQAQMFRGQEPSLKGAYQSWANEVAALRNFPTAGSKTPTVLGVGGGAGNNALPLNQGAKIPEEILNGPPEVLNKWIREVYLPGRQAQAG
jgi:hypothetical protein